MRRNAEYGYENKPDINTIAFRALRRELVEVDDSAWVLQVKLGVSTTTSLLPPCPPHSQTTIQPTQLCRVCLHNLMDLANNLTNIPRRLHLLLSFDDVGPIVDLVNDKIQSLVTPVGSTVKYLVESLGSEDL